MLDGTYGEDRWKWGNLKGGGRGEREREEGVASPRWWSEVFRRAGWTVAKTGSLILPDFLSI